MKLSFDFDDCLDNECVQEIVKELVEFSRSTHTAFDEAGINAIVEEAVKVMSEQAFRNSVSVVCTLNENVPAIRGTNLFQVFWQGGNQTHITFHPASDKWADWSPGKETASRGF